jgi:hypothetical protein
MDEVFPILAGIVVGMATDRVDPAWLRGSVVAGLALAVGAVASWLSGELAISSIYVVIDAAQVGAAAGMTAVLIFMWRRRHVRSSVR